MRKNETGKREQKLEPCSASTYALAERLAKIDGPATTPSQLVARLIDAAAREKNLTSGVVSLRRSSGRKGKILHSGEVSPKGC